jgi:hypothetical protein
MGIVVPKPINGWRVFWGEVGIIVLGVLIALGAQQVAEQWRDRQLAGQARAAIAEELNQNLLSISLRGTAEHCIQRRLGELHALVNAWGRTGTFETPSWVAQAPALEVELPRYEAAIDAGHFALLSREEQSNIGTVVNNLRRFQDIQQSESTVWPTLRMLQDGPESLSPTERTAIRAALQQAAALDYRARLLIRQALPRAAEFGFRPDRKRFEEFARTIWKSGTYSPSICAAIDTPPALANEQTGQQTPLPF